MKICPRCQHEKPLSDYYDNSTSKSGKRSECKECTKAAVNKDYDTKGKFVYTERVYGVNKERYLELYRQQNGLCAICDSAISIEGKKMDRAVVDHCHTTGNVRGLLCHYCNSGLGMFKDKESSIFRALTYIQRTKQ